MSDAAILIAAFLAGLALGAIFFGGLWWTVRRALKSGDAGRVVRGQPPFADGDRPLGLLLRLPP